MDPRFRHVCPLDGRDSAFCCVVVKTILKNGWSRHLFLFYLKREKQNKKEKTLNVTPDKKRQV